VVGCGAGCGDAVVGTHPALHATGTDRASEGWHAQHRREYSKGPKRCSSWDPSSPACHRDGQQKGVAWWLLGRRVRSSLAYPTSPWGGQASDRWGIPNTHRSEPMGSSSCLMSIRTWAAAMARGASPAPDLRHGQPRCLHFDGGASGRIQGARHGQPRWLHFHGAV